MSSLVHITTHSGKMDGIRSISTNPLTNVFCRTMHGCQNPKIICTKCYATNLVDFRKSLQKRMEDNSFVLGYDVLPMDALPRYTDELMRFNSFGEIINNNHVINVFNICYVNPETFHVIYTKKPALFAEFSHLMPDNLRVIESNFMIDDIKKQPAHATTDMIFNVVSPGYLDEHPDVKVNCMQSCNECRKCYTRRTTVRSIVELLK